MACCLFCFSDEPIEGDMRWDRPNTFQIPMHEAPTKEPLVCLGGCFCTWCFQYYIRQKALDGNLQNYKCCQGYYDQGPCQAGKCGESDCPELCLCIESFCFNSCAVSATRMMVMDTYFLQSDPMDRRLIRFNNAIQCLACICNCLAMFDRNFQQCARCIDCIAHVTFYSIAGCMTAQVNRELNFRNEQKNDLGNPPQPNMIERV
mmetsp:Transcript_35249/g.44917  ORF Transcript_35249/g.44917 Transcript_35249/m.44917 type:complete len:204 (+) Transcript_35249:85-696(+)|eukprot:CAMPEP_0117799822 /NCGR_PEP_ID=MMETSP0948-20121206/14040_1 /TAXON_ID=44440 /ORGANISM="Chattonella subsalsa, Strain CCMP2191" /LENGTH=203 /DNA_ID=CAMNT_0005631857 /DNA_START=84 /DNA_END=695 /DNA_ORIENTATION=-